MHKYKKYLGVIGKICGAVAVCSIVLMLMETYYIVIWGPRVPLSDHQYIFNNHGEKVYAAWWQVSLVRNAFDFGLMSGCLALICLSYADQLYIRGSK